MSANDTTLGKYLLIERIHQGERAETFVARSIQQDEHDVLAVKRLTPQAVADKEFVGSLLLTARLASPVKHRAVCELYDFGSIGDTHYLAREYVSGKDLRDLQRRHVLQRRLVPEPVAMYIAKQVCEGLVAIHQASREGEESDARVYGDATPRSVLIGFAGEVKLVGLCLDRRGAGGSVPPEVLQFGATLYELLTGKPPTPREAGQSSPSALPSKVRSTIPAELDQIVSRALSANVADGYASILDLNKALDDYLTTQPSAIGSASDLANLTKRIFAGALRIEKERTRRVTAAHAAPVLSSPAPVVPAGPAVLPAPSSSLGPPAVSAPGPMRTVSQVTERLPAAPARSRNLLGYVALAAGVVMVVIGVAFYVGAGARGGAAEETLSAEGQLRIVSEVPVDIFLDGESTRLSAPLLQMLPAGPHAVTIVFPTTQRKLDRQFVVQAGETVKINLVRGHRQQQGS